ncbi:hypothetical protein BRARA_B02810 [Brassica rapa]|uniref:Uncharacterized protein n=1 Tax=Brassica campestris TaxID=3711 RepID=A0A398AE65_BRACM|nr:hypothetical protein BRARA_B02810 [Brassica rapa]
MFLCQNLKCCSFCFFMFQTTYPKKTGYETAIEESSRVFHESTQLHLEENATDLSY